MKRNIIYCSCNKTTCLLKGENLNKFIGKYEIQKTINKMKKISKSNISDIYSLEQLHEKNIFNIFNKKHICEIYKEYIKLNSSYNMIIEINREWKENGLIITSENNKLNGENLKLKGLITNILEKFKEKDNIIINKDDKIKQQQDEIRILKKKNKKLENMICNTKFNSSDNSDNSDTSSENDETDDNDDNDDNMTKSSDDILMIYERIKDYMIRNNCSLTDLIMKHNMPSSFYKHKFIKLKEKRINTAHPDFDEISDHDEFFKLLHNI